MFEQLTAKLQSVVRTLRGVVSVDQKTLDGVCRQLRLALLEADVHFSVVKEFLQRVRAKALGEEVTAALSPGQQIIKIVHAELVALLGGSRSSLRLDGPPPRVVMLVGLQGTGKTTTAAKLGYRLRADGQSTLLASVDVHRAAAREQLAQIAASADLALFDEPGTDAVTLAHGAVRTASRRGDDVLVLDTAGRLHVDSEMMGEISNLVQQVQPRQVLYVADVMAGQDALAAAKAFAETIPIDGIVLTKLDGDARGGTALSVVSATGLPIVYVGVGERFEDLEPFHPERMASRILGMGDVLTLIEKAEAQTSVQDAEGLERRLRRGRITLEDFRDQLAQVRKMGSLTQLLELLPWSKTGNMTALAPDEEQLSKTEAIINSMTPLERRQPSVIDRSRRRRIAAGSGTHLADVNRLLKQFVQARKLMKKVGKAGRRGGPVAGLGNF